jgi:hypothetical protein
MRFAGIDIGGERHAVAVVNDGGTLLVKSTFFGEDAAGYQRVRDLLGDPHDCLGGDGGDGTLLAQLVRVPGGTRI